MRERRDVSPFILTSRRGLVFLCAFVGLMMFSANAFATPLLGTVPTPPGSSVFPGLIPPGTPAGTLLASLAAPYSFTTTAGTTSGTLTSAVYMNPSGTLDFYYQVENNSGSATAIARESDTSFTGFTTWTGFRTDAVGPFVAGSVAPTTADRTIMGAGSTVGFQFTPPDSAKIFPGTTSRTLVISTDATMYTMGNAEVIDGGSQTVASFQPTVIPEPVSMLLLGGGLLGLGVLRRVRR